jgi:hypothetical protein
MAKKTTNALSKYQSVLKRVRKEHPKMSFKAAQDRASRLYKSTAKVSGPKAKPKKRSITKTERIVTVGSHHKKTHSPVQRGILISRKIDDLEILLKNTSGTTAKNHVKRLINAEHDKLDAITKNLKSA